jgi:hypothetical protein
MKRFHIDGSVDDLAESIGFYATLFGSEPTRVETDYAKWMLEDPRMNSRSRPGANLSVSITSTFRLSPPMNSAECTRSWKQGTLA